MTLTYLKKWTLWQSNFNQNTLFRTFGWILTRFKHGYSMCQKKEMIKLRLRNDLDLSFNVTRGVRMSNFAQTGLSAPSRLQQCSDQGLLAKNIECLSKPPVRSLALCLVLCWSFMALQQYFSHKFLPVVCHGIPRITIAFHILPWHTLDCHENPWLMMKVCGI